MTIHTVSIRKGRKYDQVLMGARSVFMSCGYGDANMDEVARTAKVSKATVYSYFPDKQRLFIEVVKAECEHMAEHAMEEIDQTQDIRQVLHKAAGYMVNFFISPNICAKRQMRGKSKFLISNWPLINLPSCARQPCGPRPFSAFAANLAMMKNNGWFRLLLKPFVGPMPPKSKRAYISAR